MKTKRIEKVIRKRLLIRRRGWADEDREELRSSSSNDGTAMDYGPALLYLIAHPLFLCNGVLKIFKPLEVSIKFRFFEGGFLHFLLDVKTVVKEGC